MSEETGEKGFFSGFLRGTAFIWLLYFLLKGLDAAFIAGWDRPLFTRPDALQLIILTTLAFAFRHQFKRGETEYGKGIFLATFVTAMGYLICRKLNFAP